MSGIDLIQIVVAGLVVLAAAGAGCTLAWLWRRPARGSVGVAAGRGQKWARRVIWMVALAIAAGGTIAVSLAVESRSLPGRSLHSGDFAGQTEVPHRADTSGSELLLDASGRPRGCIFYYSQTLDDSRLFASVVTYTVRCTCPITEGAHAPLEEATRQIADMQWDRNFTRCVRDGVPHNVVVLHDDRVAKAVGVTFWIVTLFVFSLVLAAGRIAR